MAVMAKENMHVEQLLHLKPNINDLFYPTFPTYGERQEISNEEEDRKRERLETNYENRLGERM